jgi:hypothetical protein
MSGRTCNGTSALGDVVEEIDMQAHTKGSAEDDEERCGD